MSIALDTCYTAAGTNPTAVVDIIFRVMHRLRDDFGVRIVLDDTLAQNGLLAEWDPPRGTLHVSRSASIEEQFHVYRGLVDVLVLGYSDGAVPAAPALSLVPPLN